MNLTKNDGNTRAGGMVTIITRQQPNLSRLSTLPSFLFLPLQTSASIQCCLGIVKIPPHPPLQQFLGFHGRWFLTRAVIKVFWNLFLTWQVSLKFKSMCLSLWIFCEMIPLWEQIIFTSNKLSNYLKLSLYQTKICKMEITNLQYMK